MAVVDKRAPPGLLEAVGGATVNKMSDNTTIPKSRGTPALNRTEKMTRHNANVSTQGEAVECWLPFEQYLVLVLRADTPRARYIREVFVNVITEAARGGYIAIDATAYQALVDLGKVLGPVVSVEFGILGSATTPSRGNV